MKNTELSRNPTPAPKAITSPTSDRERAYVEEYLKHLGSLNPISRRISPSLIVTEISGPNTKWLNAKDRRCVLLSWDEGENQLPISIFFLSQTHKQNFGHASLLTSSVKNNPTLLGRIAEATQNLFSGKPEDLLSSLCPEWQNEEFGGMIDKRILWSQATECSLVIDLLTQKSKASIEFPVLPSVFSFNNLYFKELIESTDADVTKDTKILSMCCGAGLRMSYFAMKHGMIVDGVDINPIAVLNSKMIARDLKVDDLVRAWTSDGFEQVDATYDLIFMNAPLPMTEFRETDANRFDPQGEFLKKILGRVEKYLNPGGRLVLMSHRNLDAYMPTHLKYRALKNFEAKFELAISEVSRRE